ncbi:MAG TPA: response regulator [Caulobacterales bacterium]|nr:response regulator [Caulobacterales bacterium]
MPVEKLGTHPPRVLIADDNDANRGILSRLLGRRGYSVFEAESGERALDMIDEVAPDMVLLDLNMPDLSGIEILRQIRRTQDSSMLPVIMVTAEHDNEMIARCLGAGANDYVTKPVQWAVLQARIETHLSLHRAHAELLHDRDRLEASIVQRAHLITRIDQVLQHQREQALVKP